MKQNELLGQEIAVTK